MAVPLLLSGDHKVLEAEFCSGYIDAFGKWNTGFPCPATEKSSPLFCCGVATFKYCCTGEAGSSTGHVHADEPLLLFVAASLGIAAGISLLTLIACFVCPGCLLHNKRRSDVMPYSNSTLYGIGCSSGNVTPTGGATRISIGRCLQPFRSLYSMSGPLCRRTSWANVILSPQANHQEQPNQHRVSCSAIQTEIVSQCGDCATELCNPTVFTIPRPAVQNCGGVPVPVETRESEWSARSANIGRVPISMSNKLTMSTLI